MRHSASRACHESLIGKFARVARSIAKKELPLVTKNTGSRKIGRLERARGAAQSRFDHHADFRRAMGFSVVTRAHLLAEMRGNKNDVDDALPGQLIEHRIEERPPADIDHRLRLAFGQSAEPRAETAGQNASLARERRRHGENPK